MDTTTSTKFMDVFNNANYLEQVREQKSREFTNLKQDMDQKVRDYE